MGGAEPDNGTLDAVGMTTFAQALRTWPLKWRNRLRYIIAGLLPMMRGSGTGSEVMQRL